VTQVTIGRVANDKEREVLSTDGGATMGRKRAGACTDRIRWWGMHL